MTEPIRSSGKKPPIDYENKIRDAYDKAEAFVAVFSVTSRASLADVDRFLSCIHKEAQEGERQKVIVAVGNKTDLKKDREVSTEEARYHFAEMMPPIPYFEVSAKTGEHVKNVFEVVMRHWERSTTKQESSVNDDDDNQEQKQCIIN